MQFIKTMKGKRSLPLVAVALFSMALAACSSSSSSSTAATSTASAAPSSSAPATPDALSKAWANDWATLGITNPGITPTDRGIHAVDTSKYKKTGPYTIAFASQGPTNSWATIYDEALKAEAKKLGVTISYAGANGKEDKQVNDINDLLAKKPDALIVTPMGPSVKAPIERAAAQGIPVIICTGVVDSTMTVATVDRDNRLNGALSAEWIAEKIGKKGSIVMLSGIPGVPTAETRKKAAEEVFAKYPDIKILDSQYANWSPTDGKKIAEQQIVKFGKKIQAVWSDSGIQDIGVIQAFKAAGLPIPPMTGEPVNAFLKLAKANNVQFAAIGYPPSHSAICLDTAVAALQGKSVSSFVNVDVPLFTNDQIDQWIKPACSDDLWLPADSIPADVLKSLKLC
jgi:ribose transport system substrate-binding protein